ncbi:MAG: Rpn family recombination-promoting nuclease/putative transposase, partial [Fibromonadaceae bacterium]|nr:Rpn family recombination-promoting nuclease/putative transposase [Fibromonadaceae bacterium]
MPKDKNINKNELAPKGRYAKLTLDLTFKKAFASKKYSDLLITLLNTFLKKKLAHPIKAIRINNPYVQGETKDNRDAIFDIHCQDSKGNSFIVEMQMAKQAYFIKRTLFYLCMAVANSAPKSKGWNFDFPRVYSLNFINFDLDFGEGNDEIVQYLSLSNETNPKIRYTYI